MGYPIRQSSGHCGEDTVVDSWPVKRFEFINQSLVSV